jgi:general secretion pathway protein I
MNARARCQRGFTLLEILVAFVVLALVGGALLQLFQGGLHNLTTGDGYSRAALFADSTLSRLRAEPALAAGEQQGDLQDGYRYSLALSPYAEDGEIQPGLLQADLKISWGDAGHPNSYQLRTLLLTHSTDPER